MPIQPAVTPIRPRNLPVPPAKQPPRAHIPPCPDAFGLVVDALLTAQQHYLQSAREIDAMRVGTSAGEVCRLRAERIADLMDECPDVDALIARLAE